MTLDLDAIASATRAFLIAHPTAPFWLIPVALIGTAWRMIILVTRS